MSSRSIPESVRRRVRKAAKNRCGYCLSPQKLVVGKLHIEHIKPSAKGGTDEESNLWLACSPCNLSKGAKISEIDPLSGRKDKLFSPRKQNWYRHFRWASDGARIIGLTPTGRATVVALSPNDKDTIEPRLIWAEVGLYPPKE